MPAIASNDYVYGSIFMWCLVAFTSALFSEKITLKRKPPKNYTSVITSHVNWAYSFSVRNEWKNIRDVTVYVLEVSVTIVCNEYNMITPPTTNTNKKC